MLGTERLARQLSNSAAFTDEEREAVAERLARAFQQAWLDEIVRHSGGAVADQLEGKSS